MSYKYLDKSFSTKSMCDALGVPWDNEYITLDSQELLEESSGVYDEDGKDTMNINYGRGAEMSGENNPRWGTAGMYSHTEETKEHLRKVNTGKKYPNRNDSDELRQQRSERLTAYNTNRRSELRETYTDDKEYRKMYMRAYRARQKEQINNNNGIR